LTLLSPFEGKTDYEWICEERGCDPELLREYCEETRFNPRYIHQSELHWREFYEWRRERIMEEMMEESR